MSSLKKWLVALDLTTHDQSILKYARMLSDILSPEHIEFVFIAQRLPDAVHAHLPEELAYPSYDDLIEKLKSAVTPFFGDSDHIRCEVLSGPIQFDLWHETFEKDIDLFIAGAKSKHKGRGLLPKKFVRKSFCSVLFVPANIPDSIEKIWVPTDFSERSGQALEFAVQMYQEMESAPEICAHHIYQLPHAYYYHGFPEQQILGAIKEEAAAEFVQFSKQWVPDDIPINSCFTEIYHSYAANNIKEEAEQSGADLIVMASGGRSRFSKILLGSETDRLIELEVAVPLLILKEKKDHVKLWDLYSVNN